MTKTMLTLAAASFAAIILPQASQAAPVYGAASHAGVATDVSDVAYRRHRTRLYVHPYGYRRSYAADPSFGYYPSLRRFQNEGRCVVDLGYGRFEVCD
jgi:hypothetical protein